MGMRTAAWTVGILLALALSACSSSASKPGSLGKAEIARVQSLLGMSYPYRIESLGIYADGGTLGFTLMDRRGLRLAACLDGRISNLPSPEPGVDTIRLAPRHFFLGADRPDHDHARELAIGGPEELAILDMLEAIARGYFPQSTIDRIAANPESIAAYWAAPRYSEAQRNALLAGIRAWKRRHTDPAGEVIWVRGTSHADGLSPTDSLPRRARDHAVDPRR